MKRNLSLLAIFALMTLSGFAQSGKAEQLISDLSKRKFEWMIDKRLDSLEAMLDDHVKYIHSNGWTQSKKEVLDDFVTGKLAYQKIEITESTVRLFEGTAIVTGKGKFSGTVSNIKFSLELSFTEVYVTKMNQWLLVSRHANRMP